MFYACVYASVAIFSLNLYILKFLHCITAVFYGNKFKLVRIATDTLTFWTIIQTIFNSQMYILYRVTNSNISNNFTVKMMPVLNDSVPPTEVYHRTHTNIPNRKPCSLINIVFFNLKLTFFSNMMLLLHASQNC